MFTIGNDELNNNPEIGTYAKCNNCGEMHEVKYGDIIEKDGSRTPSKLLAYVNCPSNGASYLVGINGKSIK